MTAVCVYCASSTRIAPPYLALAAEVGTALAGRGHVLVTGGGASGLDEQPAISAAISAASAAGSSALGALNLSWRRCTLTPCDAPFGRRDYC